MDTMNNIMPVIGRTELEQQVEVALRIHDNIMVVGSPGSGKTQITEAHLKSLTPYVAITTPATEDPTAPSGMPVKVETENGTEVAFLPFKLMRQLVNHDPDDAPFAVILDDFGQCSPIMQAAYMQVIQDHRCGEQSFPDNVAFFLLTNDRQDKSGVKPVFEAIKQRMSAIYKYQLTLEEWIEWAYAHEIYPSIPAYLRFKPDAFNSFHPTTEMINQPCARTWHKLSKTLTMMEELGYTDGKYAAVIGAVGAVGAEFIAFEKYYTKLPDIEELLEGTASFQHDPQDPALTYALVGSIVHKAELDNHRQVIKVLSSLPEPFQIAAQKDIRAKLPDIITEDAFTDWCVDLLNIFDL